MCIGSKDSSPKLRRLQLSHEAKMGELAKFGGENNHATRMPADFTMRWWIATAVRKASSEKL
jgi:hypothetical protein